ncbi:MAG TPA: dihydrofolate reductase family protein [Caldimonas sp.]|nr:dihydrofolate reductase family protein [Caldimonas sp.]
MKRQLIVQMQMSVDAVVSADDPELNWQLWNWGEAWPWDDALKARFNQTLAGVDTILLSRAMADEGYIDHWTRAGARFDDDPHYAFARRVAEAHKRVLTRQPLDLRWPRTSQGHGPLFDEVAALKQAPGGDLIAFGGVGFTSRLLAAGVVDELQLYVNPTAVVAGRRLFGQPGQRLQLIEAAQHACGIVVNRYIPLT